MLTPENNNHYRPCLLYRRMGRLLVDMGDDWGMGKLMSAGWYLDSLSDTVRPIIGVLNKALGDWKLLHPTEGEKIPCNTTGALGYLLKVDPELAGEDEGLTAIKEAKGALASLLPVEFLGNLEIKPEEAIATEQGIATVRKLVQKLNEDFTRQPASVQPVMRSHSDH